MMFFLAWTDNSVTFPFMIDTTFVMTHFKCPDLLHLYYRLHKMRVSFYYEILGMKVETARWGDIDIGEFPLLNSFISDASLHAHLKIRTSTFWRDTTDLHLTDQIFIPLPTELDNHYLHYILRTESVFHHWLNVLCSTATATRKPNVSQFRTTRRFLCGKSFHSRIKIWVGSRL